MSCCCGRSHLEVSSPSRARSAPTFDTNFGSGHHETVHHKIQQLKKLNIFPSPPPVLTCIANSRNRGEEANRDTPPAPEADENIKVVSSRPPRPGPPQTANSTSNNKNSKPQSAAEMRVAREANEETAIDPFEGPMEPVIANIYHLIDAAPNCKLATVGLGLHHTGLVVYGMEWSYGEAVDSTQVSGIFAVKPGCGMPNLKQSLVLGYTKLSPEQVDTCLHRLENEWLSVDYHVTHNNCNHFVDYFLGLLSCGLPPPPMKLPAWVNRIANGIDWICPKRLASWAVRAIDGTPPVAVTMPVRDKIGNIPPSVVPIGWYKLGQYARPPKYTMIDPSTGMPPQNRNGREGESSTLGPVHGGREPAHAKGKALGGHVDPAMTNCTRHNATDPSSGHTRCPLPQYIVTSPTNESRRRIDSQHEYPAEDEAGYPTVQPFPSLSTDVAITNVVGTAPPASPLIGNSHNAAISMNQLNTLAGLLEASPPSSANNALRLSTIDIGVIRSVSIAASSTVQARANPLSEAFGPTDAANLQDEDVPMGAASIGGRSQGSKKKGAIDRREYSDAESEDVYSDKGDDEASPVAEDTLGGTQATFRSSGAGSVQVSPRASANNKESQVHANPPPNALPLVASELESLSATGNSQHSHPQLPSRAANAPAANNQATLRETLKTLVLDASDSQLQASASTSGNLLAATTEKGSEKTTSSQKGGNISPQHSYVGTMMVPSVPASPSKEAAVTGMSSTDNQPLLLGTPSTSNSGAPRRNSLASSQQNGWTDGPINRNSIRRHIPTSLPGDEDGMSISNSMRGEVKREAQANESFNDDEGGRNAKSPFHPQSHAELTAVGNVGDRPDANDQENNKRDSFNEGSVSEEYVEEGSTPPLSNAKPLGNDAMGSSREATPPPSPTSVLMATSHSAIAHTSRKLMNSANASYSNNPTALPPQAALSVLSVDEENTLALLLGDDSSMMGSQHPRSQGPAEEKEKLANNNLSVRDEEPPTFEIEPSPIRSQQLAVDERETNSKSRAIARGPNTMNISRTAKDHLLVTSICDVTTVEADEVLHPSPSDTAASPSFPPEGNTIVFGDA